MKPLILFEAIHNKKSKGFKAALLPGNPLQCRLINDENISILDMAIMEKKNELVRYIIQHFPALINRRGRNEFTPLLHACKWRNAKAFKALIKAGADINSNDCNGFPLISSLIEHDDIEYYCMLVDAGVDMDVPCRMFTSLVYLIIQHQRVKMLEYLSTSGFDLFKAYPEPLIEYARKRASVRVYNEYYPGFLYAVNEMDKTVICLTKLLKQRKMVLLVASKLLPVDLWRMLATFL